jgi:hypothetical protein
LPGERRRGRKAQEKEKGEGYVIFLVSPKPLSLFSLFLSARPDTRSSSSSYSGAARVSRFHTTISLLSHHILSFTHTKFEKKRKKLRQKAPLSPPLSLSSLSPSEKEEEAEKNY